jgi:hypothetical protein
MKLDIQAFRGEAPRLTPRALPPEGAQEAMNCRMETGDLLPFRQFVNEKTLAAAASTIYKLNGAWLSWNAQVDVARGLIPGDTNFFTFLTSPGLYTTPRYTTYALATTGAEPFPVATRPLGMPAPTLAPTLVAGVDPTPTTFSVDITDTGAELATAWTTSLIASGSNFGSNVTQDVVVGNAQPSYKLSFYNNNTDKPCYAYRNFGVATAAAVQMEVDTYMTAAGGQYQSRVRIANDASGAGLNAQVHFPRGTGGGAYLAICKVTNWADAGSGLDETALPGLTMATWYRIKITLTANDDFSTKIVATIALASTPTVIIATVDHTVPDLILGDYCGFNAVAADLGGGQQTNFDNIHVTASGSTGFVAVNTATAYVYTFINDNVGGAGVLWESAPSPASATVLRPDGIAVTVTTATTHAYDVLYGINKKRIYRAVSGATGDIFLLVDTITLATATYVDVLDDSVISTPGTPLESEDWDLPPANMQGIKALPNNTMMGFFGNQLCFSEVGRPHAWPVRYRLTTDTDIVAIENIDNTVVLGTKSFVYTATGNDPASYSMSKPGEAQACVAKLSMKFVDGYGVCFASPDGYQVCAGSAGNVANATEKIFTKPQWESLVPSSIKAAVYDGGLYFWVTGTTPSSGYVLDTKPDGAGLVRLSHFATAVHVDPLTDAMFVLLGVNSEPTDASLPLASTAVAASTTVIYQWDAHATNKIVYRWKGKLNLMPYETTLHFGRLKAEDYTNVLARVYGDGAEIFEKVGVSEIVYRVPGTRTYSKYEQELMGTSRVRTYQLAQDPMEFT